MTSEELYKANALSKEIHDLTWFVKTCRSCWRVLRIKAKIKSLKLKTVYGALNDEIEVNTELSEKILNVIEQHIYEKEKEFEEI